MAEKPILFNTPMVKAILEGRKRNTRRIIKGLPLYEPFFEEDEGRGWLEDKGNGSFYALEAFSKVQPGDILWVRETWNYGYVESSDAEGSHETWFEELRKPVTGYLGALSRYFYIADEADKQIMDEIGGKWRPSIHMPRKAARIFLEVEDVRAERLQSITPIEIMDEGLDVRGMTKQETFKAWADLWDSTIKKSDSHINGWEANPWVWVYEFERIEGA